MHVHHVWRHQLQPATDSLCISHSTSVDSLLLHNMVDILHAKIMRVHHAWKLCISQQLVHHSEENIFYSKTCMSTRFAGARSMTHFIILFSHYIYRLVLNAPTDQELLAT